MCGFVGFYGELLDKQKVISKMTDIIKHRGPDSDGIFTDDNIAMGFRRLSIIDLAGGDQPMHSVDDRYILTFNGEIYNYRDLRKDLVEKFGTVFNTMSDSETIIEVYRHYGEKTASMLRGMFAFVIYDRQENILYGARDYFGIKPFYYTYVGGNFVYGSEIKSFMVYPGFKKEINHDALKMYLVFQYSPLEECIFKGVWKLLPGTCFTYKNGELKTTKYFVPTFNKQHRAFDNVVDIIDETIAASVEYHKIADVEVGSFLSGGVDSSYLAKLLKPMHTYTVGFEVPGFDECALAQEFANMEGFDHRMKEISADEFFDALPHVQYHSDEPDANLSAVPLYYLAQLAAKDIKVVLSGEGADEFFGGYDWYTHKKITNNYRKLPHGLRKGLASAFGWIPSAEIKHFLKSNAEELEDSYIGQAFIMDDDEANSFLKPKYRRTIVHQDITRPYYDKVKNEDELTKKMYLDMNVWLPGNILLKADKMTMAHSLELRVPFLDKEVWNVARTLCPEHKTDGKHAKLALRASAFRYVPKEWAERKKVGFRVPFREWIKEEKYNSRVREMFHKDFAAEFFDVPKLDALLDGYLASGISTEARKVYTIYSFLLWYEQYFINKRAEA